MYWIIITQIAMKPYIQIIRNKILQRPYVFQQENGLIANHAPKIFFLQSLTDV